MLRCFWHACLSATMSPAQERMSGEGRPQTLVNFGCGVAAAVAATLLTQPADVVRTRMQLGLGVAGAKPLGPYGTLVQVLKQQGPSALLIGRCSMGLFCAFRWWLAHRTAIQGRGTCPLLLCLLPYV